MWLTTMTILPLAIQEASGEIKAYHVKLKLKLYDDSYLRELQRVDWLVHKFALSYTLATGLTDMQMRVILFKM
ncbi:hypothetical protein CQW23_26167 [Capsicum baccatum]|uniref:Uncharacterized protein n=1 Tax=Capsicum baccatum TaxID=33114 RepID=A0A2G2VN23_CAPBA|nr:hypothetical protein CQW23_26167 [Capsicum baccatum]